MNGKRTFLEKCCWPQVVGRLLNWVKLWPFQTRHSEKNLLNRIWSNRQFDLFSTFFFSFPSSYTFSLSTPGGQLSPATKALPGLFLLSLSFFSQNESIHHHCFLLSILNRLAGYLQGLPSGIAGEAPVLLLQESSDEEAEPLLPPPPEPESLCWCARVTPSWSASSKWSDWWT